MPSRNAGIKPAHDQGAQEQGHKAPRAGHAARAADRPQRFVLHDVIVLVLLASSMLVLTIVILLNQQRSIPSDAMSGRSAEFDSMQPEAVPAPAQDRAVEPEPIPDEAASEAPQELDLESAAEVDEARRELEAEIQAEWELLKAEQRRAETETVEQEPLPAEPVE